MWHEIRQSPDRGWSLSTRFLNKQSRYSNETKLGFHNCRSFVHCSTSSATFTILINICQYILKFLFSFFRNIWYLCIIYHLYIFITKKYWAEFTWHWSKGMHFGRSDQVVVSDILDLWSTYLKISSVHLDLLIISVREKIVITYLLVRRPFPTPLRRKRASGSRGRCTQRVRGRRRARELARRARGRTRLPSRRRSPHRTRSHARLRTQLQSRQRRQTARARRRAWPRLRCADAARSGARRAGWRASPVWLVASTALLVSAKFHIQLTFICS